MLEPNWRKEAETDRLKKGEKVGQLVGVVVTVLVAIFLTSHWTGDTRFYTQDFSELDAAVLFGPLLFSIVPSVFRMVLGRKNAVRPWDILGSLLFVLSAAYFLCCFHFDMQYFADPLPEGLRFVIDWIDEGWARFFLILGVAGGTLAIGWTTLTYLKVKDILDRKE